MNRNKKGHRKSLGFYSITVIMAAATLLWGCEEVSSPTSVGDFTGTYEVVGAKEGDVYTLTVTRSEVTQYSFQIANLANLLKQPVAAQAYGGQLTIPAQTVLGDDNRQILVSGSGQLDGGSLYLRYQIKGAQTFDGSVRAQKK